jgi:hypothetical protein
MQAEIVDAALRESAAPVRGRSAALDPRALRGTPIRVKSVSSAIPGTELGSATSLERVDRALRRRRRARE